MFFNKKNYVHDCYNSCNHAVSRDRILVNKETYCPERNLQLVYLGGGGVSGWKVSRVCV